MAVADGGVAGPHAAGLGPSTSHQNVAQDPADLGTQEGLAPAPAQEYSEQRLDSPKSGGLLSRLRPSKSKDSLKVHEHGAAPPTPTKSTTKMDRHEGPPIVSEGDAGGGKNTRFADTAHVAPHPGEIREEEYLALSRHSRQSLIEKQAQEDPP